MLQKQKDDNTRIQYPKVQKSRTVDQKMESTMRLGFPSVVFLFLSVAVHMGSAMPMTYAPSPAPTVITCGADTCPTHSYCSSASICVCYLGYSGPLCSQVALPLHIEECLTCFFQVDSRFWGALAGVFIFMSIVVLLSCLYKWNKRRRQHKWANERVPVYVIL